MRGWGTYFFISALTAASASAHDAPTLSRSELKTLPAPVLAQRIADDIADFVRHSNPDSRDTAEFSKIAETLGLDRDAPTRAIAAAIRTNLPGVAAIRPDKDILDANTYLRAELRSKPYAVKTASLCRMDTYQVFYRPMGNDQSADAPLHFIRVSIVTAYHFLVSPAAVAATPADASQHEADATACAKLDSDKDSFFRSWDEAGAVRGMWLYQSLKAGFAMKTLPFEIDCNAWTTPDGCRGLIASQLPETPEDVSCLGWEPSCIFYLPDNKLVDVRHDSGPTPKIVRVAMPSRFPPAVISPRKP
jgi:hypothetical protein